MSRNGATKHVIPDISSALSLGTDQNLSRGRQPANSPLFLRWMKSRIPPTGLLAVSIFFAALAIEHLLAGVDRLECMQGGQSIHVGTKRIACLVLV